MNPRPCVLARVAANVLSERPDVELVGVGRTLEDVGVIAIHAPFGLDNHHLVVGHHNLIVVTLPTPHELETSNPANGLHVAKDLFDELALE